MYGHLYNQQEQESTFYKISQFEGQISYSKLTVTNRTTILANEETSNFMEDDVNGTDGINHN